MNDADIDIVLFVKDYVQKRRRIAKKQGKRWPGANAVPFIHNLARMVPNE